LHASRQADRHPQWPKLDDVFHWTESGESISNPKSSHVEAIRRRPGQPGST
jgi:hypothetical protein